MKNFFGIVISVVVILGFLTWLGIYVSKQRGTDETYLLPSGFEGCVVIKYNVKGAEPLKIKNNEIILKVPDSGVIETSSPSDIGWVNDEHSGQYQVRAYYVDEKGEKVEELPREKIRFGALGSSQEEGKPKQEHFYQIFGSKETENKGCPQLGI